MVQHTMVREDPNMKFRITKDTTVKDIIDKIEDWSSTNNFYQVYVIAEKTHSFKKYHHYAQLYKGEWCYREIVLRVYAHDIKEEYTKHVTKVDIEWAKHISVGWRGASGEGQHPVYLIHVDSIGKKNVARSVKLGENLIPYTKEEMKGKRFSL